MPMIASDFVNHITLLQHITSALELRSTDDEPVPFDRAQHQVREDVVDHISLFSEVIIIFHERKQQLSNIFMWS